MCPESEPQANDVRKEQQDRSEPAVRADCFQKELIIDSRNLREVAASAILVRPIIMATAHDNTGMACEFVL